MLSVIPTSPYCARETIGGTRAVPRTVVGIGEVVGGGDATGDGLAVGVGLVLVLAGVTQAPTASDAEMRRAAVLMAASSCTALHTATPYENRAPGLAHRIGR